uniref:WAT1-related protein n=1 Tax=Oryza nivara TaxID=4536 RepID=A0A0E0J943_ORYNI
MAERLLLPLSMVLVQLFTIGALLLAKLSFNSGMAPFVLLAYRNLIGTVTMLPFAFWFERQMMKKVNYKVLGWIFFNALFGLEKLKLKTRSGMIKVIGTVICVVGTMVVSLYRGKLLHLWPTHLLKPAQLRAIGGSDDSTFPTHHNMLIGTLFLCGSCLSYAFWFIVQAKVNKEFPSKYFSTMLACLMGTIQAVVIGIAVDRDRSAWALHWDLQLITIIYSGVFNTAATFCLITWAVSRRGPTYPSMFNSLALIITVVLDSMLLGSDISVGSLLGAFMIIIGLYSFLWGKGKEIKEQQQQVPTNTEADQSKITYPKSNGEVRIMLDT